MAFYELRCLACDVLYEVGCQREVPIKNIFCPECKSPKKELLKYDDDLSIRLRNIEVSVFELTKRVDRIEDSLFIDDENFEPENPEDTGT